MLQAMFAASQSGFRGTAQVARLQALSESLFKGGSDAAKLDFHDRRCLSSSICGSRSGY
jgi:hypothetical protein